MPVPYHLFFVFVLEIVMLRILAITVGLLIGHCVQAERIENFRAT